MEKINLAERLATEIQEHVEQRCANSNFTIVRGDREDFATAFVEDELQHIVEPPSLAWDGLGYWFQRYRS